MKNASDLDKLVELILTYQGKDGYPYIERFDRNYILNNIEEKSEIQLIEKHFQDFDPKGLDIIDFAKAFLNLIPHQEDETLYLTIALIDLYKDINETFDLKNKVKASDVLNYIVDVFSFPYLLKN